MSFLKYYTAWAYTQKLTFRRYKLLKHYFKNLEDAWKCVSVKQFLEATFTQKTAEEIIIMKKNIDPQKCLDEIQKWNIKLLFLEDTNYPRLLKEITDPPVFLFYKGQFYPKLFLKTISIVGTRKYTSYGKQLTKEFTQGIVQNGITVVSGLAYGIDSIAHRSTLENNGKTIAVLGSGLNQIYPIVNRQLARDIEVNGLLVSEYPPFTEAQEFQFPRRNRIIAGLSKGTLVIEAGQKSGALITSRLALEYNRETFAVPGNIYNLQSKGTNKVISKGEAKLVTSYKEVLQELHFESVNEQKKNTVTPENEIQKEIISLISQDNFSANEIIQKLGKNPCAINRELSMMEIKGMIRSIGEKWIIGG